MECAICFNIIRKSAVGLCNHHFCFQCLVRWCHFSNVCPKCKARITEIKFDPEYDILVKELSKLNVDIENIGNEKVTNEKVTNENNSFREVIKNQSINTNVMGGGNIKELVISFNNKEIGITIHNNNDGPGVKITNIDVGGRGQICGLKKGDILLFINNVPCINHIQSIRIFKESMRSNKDAICMVF
jgi:hypothetical protein